MILLGIYTVYRGEPMRSVRLFDEPFDLDDIDKALRDPKFRYAAFLMLGFSGAWHCCLDQIDRLLSAYEAAGRDDRRLWEIIVVVMIKRAETFDDTSAFLDDLVERLGILPGTTYFELIKLAHLHKIDPQAWLKKQHRDWLDNYLAQTKALREQRTSPVNP